MNSHNPLFRFVVGHYADELFEARRGYDDFCRRTGYRSRRPLARWMAAAAVAVVLVCAGAYTLLRDATTTYETDATARVVMLADGTRVTLAPHSRLSVSQRDCRTTEMAGRAYFEVHHDEQRPFHVRSQRGHVMVLGTTFEVAESAAATRVAVTSGAVRFAAKGHEQAGLTLTRGQGATLAYGSHTPRLLAVSANAGSWATHQLHFSNTPIDSVVADINAHYGTHLTASRHDCRLTGDFDTGALATLVSVIEETLDIELR